MDFSFKKVLHFCHKQYGADEQSTPMVAIAIGSSSSDYKLYISGSGSSSAADQTLYMDAGVANSVQLAMANGYNARQGVTFINNGSASNTSFGLISENTSDTH